MNVKVIYWTTKQMYYAGFDIDAGALWTIHKYGGYLIENSNQLERHLQVLTQLEGIPLSHLGTQDTEEC